MLCPSTPDSCEVFLVEEKLDLIFHATLQLPHGHLGLHIFFRWDTYLYISLFPSVRPSVCRAAYLMNRTSSDHNFWYTYVKWWYLQAVSFIFSKFYFFELLGGKRAKSGPIWEITVTSVTHHISGPVHYLIIICGTLISNHDISGRFFHVFFILIFGAVKGQKTAQNEK